MGLRTFAKNRYKLFTINGLCVGCLTRAYPEDSTFLKPCPHKIPHSVLRAHRSHVVTYGAGTNARNGVKLFVGLILRPVAVINAVWDALEPRITRVP